MEDHSAKTFDRPEWKKLLADLKKSKGKNCDLIMFTKWGSLAEILLMPMA